MRSARFLITLFLAAMIGVAVTYAAKRYTIAMPHSLSDAIAGVFRQID